MLLVIGATNNEELNRQISEDAQRLNKLCNIADRPEACNFILPSFINRGDLIIAVSTSGKSPALAKKLRKDLENEFGQEYAEFLRLMEVIRQRLLSKNRDSKTNKYLFEQLISRGLIEMIKNQKEAEINSLLFEILGNGFEFEALMRTNPL
jgi:precorrin-2 dehydrogenase/sirohydrochlorin ferrochelatase